MKTSKEHEIPGATATHLDSGGKRSATPLLCAPNSPALRAGQSGVVASLCHRSPSFLLQLSVRTGFETERNL